jgi:Tol biopolymer transport system component
MAVIAAVPAAGVIAKRSPRLSTSQDGALLSGGITEAVLAGNASTAVFATTATNFVLQDPADRVADIVSVSLLDGTRRVVSSAPDGTAPDGSSSTPSVSGNGQVVAFVSSASNLVAGDANGVLDIFARAQGGPVVRVSAAADGGQANGPSFQPDISADGRYVAFTSVATNLVPDDTNGQADVFIRDLKANTTRRVSLSDAGGQGSRRSSAPAVSADGAAVAFESAAPDLVVGDTNGVADVFVRVLATGRTERVSRSSAGIQQDRGVSAPFTAAPDISGDGRYVVFDTEARSLYRHDTNRRSDIYLRDRLKDTTTLVSASSFNVQGDNDSVTPRITPNGRFVTFQSFAANLVQDDGPREDLFVRDRRSGTTTLVNATDSGARRRREPLQELLQRAPISDDGRIALFASAAPNIDGDPTGGVVQLYQRRLVAPRIALVGKVRRSPAAVRLNVAADDKRARRYLCRIDQAVPYACGRSITVSRRAGKMLSIRAGGPGMLWSRALSVRLAGR